MICSPFEHYERHQTHFLSFEDNFVAFNAKSHMLTLRRQVHKSLDRCYKSKLNFHYTNISKAISLFIWFFYFITNIHLPKKNGIQVEMVPKAYCWNNDAHENKRKRINKRYFYFWRHFAPLSRLRYGLRFILSRMHER